MELPRHIERSRDDRVVAGVCAGVARASGLDPTTVRIAAVVLVAFGGIGLLAYVAAALLLPEEGGGAPLIRMAGDDRDRGAAVAGIAILAVLAVIVVSGDPWPLDNVGLVVTVVVLGGLAWLLLRRDPDAGPAPAAPVVAPPRYGAPLPDGTVRVAPSWESDRPAPAWEPPPPRDPRRGRIASAVAGSVVLAVLAGGAIVLQLTFADPPWDVYAAGAVIVFGWALLLSAPFGGARGLIVPGFLVAATAGVLLAADLPLRGGAGERDFRPTEPAALAGGFELGAGELHLDLTGVNLPIGTTRTEVDQAFGNMTIVVPEDVEVAVDATVVGGEATVFGATDDGLDVHSQRTDGDSPRRLEIDARLGFGQLTVKRQETP